jgi:hypothetical protein
VYAFEGDAAVAKLQAERAARHEDWGELQEMTDLVPVPAACYPAIAARDTRPPAGVFVDTGAVGCSATSPRTIPRAGRCSTYTSWSGSASPAADVVMPAAKRSACPPSARTSSGPVPGVVQDPHDPLSGARYPSLSYAWAATGASRFGREPIGDRESWRRRHRRAGRSAPGQPFSR